MTTTTHSYIPRDVHQSRGQHPWCPTCDTDRHLFVESPAVPTRQADTLAVAIRCSKYHRSKVLETTAAHLAALAPAAPVSGGEAARTSHQPPALSGRRYTQMTNNSHTTAPEATPANGPKTPAAAEDLDLTPEGLANAPALQQDPDSLVHTGNS